MKINFKGSYEQVSGWLKEGQNLARNEDISANFTKKLAQFINIETQDVENTKKIIKSEIAKKEEIKTEPEARARLNFPKFDLSTPKIDFKPEPKIQEVLPDSNSTSVKTPTLIDAHRLKSFEAPKTPIAPLAERINLSKDLIIEAGKKNGIDPALAMSVVNTESGFNPNAISKDGHASKGLFQLLDKTGKTIIDRLGFDKDYNPYDPKQNVEFGMSYLRYLHDIFSSNSEINDKIKSSAAANSDSLEKLAIAAFNAGEGRVASAQARAKKAGNNPAEYSQVEAFLPKSTQSYVAKVISQRDKFAEKINS